MQFFNWTNGLRGKSLVAAWLLSLLLAGAAVAAELQIETGSSGVAAGPICFAPDQALEADKAYALVNGNERIIAQTDTEGRLYWWTKQLKPNQTITYSLQPVDAQPRVKVAKRGDDQLEVTVAGQPFTCMNFKKDEPKVYLYPVIGPTGAPMTRDYVMRENPIEKENNRQDHHHHRSLWTAHGDVRVDDFGQKGYDFWAEPKERPNSRQVLTRVLRTQSGPVFGRIVARIEWRTPEGRRLFSENRTYTFFAGDEDQRVIDQQNVFEFNDGDVMFADTKEGGIFSIRLAVTMDEVGVKTPEEMHGQMINSRGQVGEKQCWGKPAEWCDYVGPVQGETVGVAVFDNPRNLGHPTTWHIRGYGLYTANPFGLRDFTGDKSQNSSKVWKKGESTEFNYRAIFHKGDSQAANIAGQYKAYASPPKIDLR